MFSDEVIGLSIAHRRQSNQAARAAQSIVDELATDVRRLQAKLRQAYLELETERGRRLVAEARLEEILDLDV